jgi:hypothetical protein
MPKFKFFACTQYTGSASDAKILAFGAFCPFLNLISLIKIVILMVIFLISVSSNPQCCADGYPVGQEAQVNCQILNIIFTGTAIRNVIVVICPVFVSTYRQITAAFQNSFQIRI